MNRPDPALPGLRWPSALIIAVVAMLPFAFVAIPPLTDVPGHIGGFSVQTASAASGLSRYFAFHWALTLNLASDAIVQLLYPIAGVVPVTWALCALTPALTVIGIIGIARALNPRGAYALPWALLFVFNFPFLWGFLNFDLTMALGMIAFAAWVAMADRPHMRAALFVVVTPLLLIGHGVAGVATIALIVGHAIGSGGWQRWGVRRLAALWPPLIAALVTLIVWKAAGVSGGSATMWLFYRKADAIMMMLRDQNVVLDVGSVIACGVVWWLGRRWGARLGNGAAGAAIALLLLLFLTPSQIGGSDEIDARLAPLIPMLAFAAQDWSAVPPRRRHIVALLGVALLLLRFGVTTASFIGYDDRYRRELAALDHVARGARVLNLTEMNCGVPDWRSERLEHLANLATTRRDAWVNAHWSIAGLQLLQIRDRPSRIYDRDPSQMIWPARCSRWDRPTLLTTMPHLPLDRVDYLWLIGTRLPAGYRDPRLSRVWSEGASELYAIRPARESR